MQSRLEVQLALDEVYKLYPKKLGKLAGMRNAIKQLKTIDDVELLRDAIIIYRKYLSENRVELRYTLHFSTFMNQWRDWLEFKDQVKPNKWERIK